MVGFDREEIHHESSILGDGMRDVGAQRFRKLGIAPNVAEVDQDVAQQKLGLGALAKPDYDLFAPFRNALSPNRVGGHDVAQAPREADRIELVYEALGKRNEIGVDARVLDICVVRQYESIVVLIRRQKAFAAAAGTHDDQRERYRRLIPSRRLPSR